MEDRKLYEEDEGIAGCPWEDDKPIVDWHRDSYPFVCVTMLSDCTNMQGGETALRTGDNNIMRVRGPGKVSKYNVKGFQERFSYSGRDAQSSFKDVTLNTKLFELSARANASHQSPHSAPSTTHSGMRPYSARCAEFPTWLCFIDST